MAAVRTAGEVFRHRASVVTLILILLVFLTPIFWITATAFKPRNLATTVPPTVFFQPEISPFVKLFTKRSQLREPVTEEAYAAAPWWEKLVFDGGEQVVTSSITKDAALDLGLQVGQPATVFIKSTEVTIGVD